MSESDRAPSSQFYWKDWLSDVAVNAMTFEQRGHYFHYLAMTHQTDSPGRSSEEEVRQLACYSVDEWKENREAIRRAFRVEPDGTWIQKRTVRARDVQRVRHEKSVTGGRRSALRPRGAGGRFQPQPRDGVGTPSSSSSSASASPSAIQQNPTPQPLPPNHASAPPGRRGQPNEGTRGTKGAASGKAGLESLAAVVGRTIPGVAQPEFEPNTRPLSIEFIAANESRFPNIDVHVVAAEIKDQMDSGEVSSPRGLFMYRCRERQEQATKPSTSLGTDGSSARAASPDPSLPDSDPDGEAEGL